MRTEKRRSVQERMARKHACDRINGTEQHGVVCIRREQVKKESGFVEEREGWVEEMEEPINSNFKRLDGG
jgi:hypothetical protein